VKSETCELVHIRPIRYGVYRVKSVIHFPLPGTGQNIPVLAAEEINRFENDILQFAARGYAGTG
jgi:hypothetical protein